MARGAVALSPNASKPVRWNPISKVKNTLMPREMWLDAFSARQATPLQNGPARESRIAATVVDTKALTRVAPRHWRELSMTNVEGDGTAGSLPLMLPGEKLRM